MNSDIDEFLAQLDELSSGSISVDQQLLKEKQKNQRMNKLLVSLQSSTKDILSIYKNERLITIELQEKLSQSTETCNKLERQYDELRNTYDNNSFLHIQLMEELKQKQSEERQDYINLSKDYLELLSEATCFNNYEIKKSQNKIISKSEHFLCSIDRTWKRPKLIRSRRTLDNENDEARSTMSRTSSRNSKRRSDKSKADTETKRRKADIWDLKSISQVSSPAAGIPFDYEETSDLSSDLCGAESSFSFNTFSIGNETSFSSLQSQRSPPGSASEVSEVIKCRCHLFAENDASLVSIGTNTDPPEVPLPSVPSLIDDDLDPSLDLWDDKGENNVHQRLLNLTASSDFPVPSKPSSPVKSIQETVQEVSSTSDAKEKGEKGKVRKENNSNCQKSVLGLSGDSKLHEIVSARSPPTSDVIAAKQTVDQGTSPEPTETCDKSTATVHSTTTRGTSTVSVAKRSFGVQFPELSMESVFTEIIFDMPGCLSPIHELEDLDDQLEMDEDELPQKEMKSSETMTELCNVTREIEYLSNSPTKVKAEKSPMEFLLGPSDSEDNSFIILGQTLFDLFLKRMQKSNQLLSNDDITRQKIWKHLKRQLVDRFSELSFDETLNGSFSDSELIEEIPVDDVFNNTKKGLEEIAVSSNDISEEMEVESNDEEFLKQDTMPEPLEIFPDNVEEVPVAVKASPRVVEDDLVISSDSELSDATSDDFEEIFNNLKKICFSPPRFIEPIDDLADVIWGSLFPEDNTEAQEIEDCPMEIKEVLDGFDVDQEPIVIPTENDNDYEVEEILQSANTSFTEFDTPKSPLLFMIQSEISPDAEVVIPTESSGSLIHTSFDSVLNFDRKVKSRVIQWQEINKVSSKKSDRDLCKLRRSIKSYLESEWTDENLEKCCKTVASINCLLVIKEAIFETVQDNKCQKEISVEFTPPAPPLPPYQQKLIVLIKKLSEIYPQLPQKLIEDLEEKLFRFDNSAIDSDDLRNIGYYYSSLVDLFLEGDSTTVFYFIVKCIYYYSFKSVPIVFVLLKAFPQALPRKFELLKKNCKDIDWENMTGIELSKVFFDFECMDSLDLTVVFMISNFQEEERIYLKDKTKKNKKKKPPGDEPEHELFPFFSRFYGYFNNFILRRRLLQVLMKRLEEGNLTNLSLSLILLAKRSTCTYSLGTIVKEHLMPMLDKYYTEVIKSEENAPKELIAKLCLVIESISAIMKTFGEEKDKTIRVIFTKFVTILSSVNNHEIQENCLRAILRLQRFSDNQKEIFEMIKIHHEKSSGRMNESLRFAIKTFIHRKCERFIKDAN